MGWLQFVDCLFFSVSSKKEPCLYEPHCRPQGTVFDLHKLILSPSIRQVYDSYVAGGREVEVVIYIHRPRLLFYRSLNEDRVVQLKYLPDWHEAGN